jgi:hypothetical protein
LYLPDIRTETPEWHLSIFKEFQMTGRMVTQYRAEFFNAWNTPRLGGPNTSVTSSPFGVLSGQSNCRGRFSSV